MIFSWGGGGHMVFRGNRGGVDRQLSANEEGGVIRIFQRLEGGQVDRIVTQSKSSDTQAINYSDRSHC